MRLTLILSAFCALFSLILRPWLDPAVYFNLEQYRQLVTIYIVVMVARRDLDNFGSTFVVQAKTEVTTRFLFLLPVSLVLVYFGFSYSNNALLFSFICSYVMVTYSSTDGTFYFLSRNYFIINLIFSVTELIGMVLKDVKKKIFYLLVG